MEKPAFIAFDDFSLDMMNEYLWKGSEKINLRPKTFALLCYLVARPGRLITKRQLFDAIWQNCFVGDDALKHCVADIRKALGDDADKPKFIETVHGRGYRFIGETRPKQPANAGKAPNHDIFGLKPAAGGCQLVGRASELAQLRLCLNKAIGGVRQIVFISGEQGIGKTSLIDAFLDEVNAERDTAGLPGGSTPPTRPWITRGQCIKSHGSSEAYMPVLEALAGLCNDANRLRVSSILYQYAPLWLLQMPSLITPDKIQNLRRTMLDATRERMLREMAEAMEALASSEPLILVLEDLHWSDYSTLDLISYLARRRLPAQLLLIGSFRSGEAAENHPLKTVKRDLHAHQQCQELPLQFLDEAAIKEYIMNRFPENRFPAEIVPWIHRRTGGNPLFMVNVLDHLAAQGLLTSQNNCWFLNVTLEQAEQAAPPTIQEIIEQQVSQCSRKEQQLLEAGCVEGVEFSVAAVASVMHSSAGRIESLCRGLVRRNHFLQPGSVRQLPGGRQTAIYKFVHVLYQNVWYQLLPESLRMQLHLRLAKYLEHAYNKKPGNMAARLAMHFEQGREYNRAIEYYQKAAEDATMRYAGREALALTHKLIHLLEMSPEPSERAYIEMTLQIALGSELMAKRGLGAEEVKQAFTRARELYQTLDQSQRKGKITPLFSALYGLWNYHWVRAEFEAARELANQLLRLAQTEKDATLLGYAHFTMGMIMMDHGEFEGAIDHLNRGDNVSCRFCVSLTMWNLGFPVQAMRNMDATLAMAIESHIPEDAIFAHVGAARVYMACRDSKKAMDLAQAAQDMAHRHGLVEQWTAPMRCIRGWALAKLGQVDSAIEEISQALTTFKAIGIGNLLPFMTAIFAEVLLDAGQIEKGLEAAEEALQTTRKNEYYNYEAEILRIKGELLLQKILAEPSDHGCLQFQEAEACLEEAIATAAKQQAKSFELRATTSLARLLRKQGRQQEARERLLKIYEWFTEGHDTLDQLEARELLQK